MTQQGYLQKYQKILYQTFSRALEKKQVSHAYLLVGEPGTPLLSTAKYLAKTLVCDHPSPFACNTCFTCLRIDDGNYADFILLDGSQKTIKKEEIQVLESAFEKTALEDKGKMIYIIHLVENMTVEAINSLLKFLEEPEENIYAFLTTENELKVLPTILSRTQKIPLKKIPQEDILKECSEHEISTQDAELLSFFYQDIPSILEAMESDDYQVAHHALDLFLHALTKSKENALFVMQTEIANEIRSKEKAKCFFDLFVVCCQEMLAIKGNYPIFLQSYATILKKLANQMDDIESEMLLFMEARGKLDLNINIPLLLDHMCIQWIKGGLLDGRK